MPLIFHRLVQKDLRTVLDYYEKEGGTTLADRFFADFETVVNEIEAKPRTFHFTTDSLRRTNMKTFPYHLLFRESPRGVRVLVLRHHKRHPRFGLIRK